MRIYFPFRILTCVAGLFFLSASFANTAEDVPMELQRAREDYEDEFFRKLESTQGKYCRVLKQYQADYTRDQNLRVAEEAQREYQLAENWETVPVQSRPRSMTDPKLDTLLKNYEKACQKVIDPITERYVKVLERLKKGFAQSGELDASLSVETEILKVKQGKGLPAEKGGLRYLASLTKREFSIWLEEQSFDFSGTVAGRVTLKFEKGKVEYGRGIMYDYEVTKTRTVEIHKGGTAAGFIIEFSDDLQSATFISNVGEYPVRINGKEPINQ